MRSRRVQELRMGFLALPAGVRTVAGLGVTAPVVLAWFFAMEGRADRPLLVWCAVVAVVTGWVTERDARHLDRQGRRAVAETVSSGRPSGDPAVDYVAERRLERASRFPYAVNWACGAIVWLTVLGAPALAAFRGSPWWLCSWAVAPVIALVTPPEAFFGRPAHRLYELRLAMGTRTS